MLTGQQRLNEGYNIDLPDIDGNAEVGLAVGTDKGLPENRKLHVLKNGEKKQKIMYAAASAELMADKVHDDMVLAAAVAVEKFKLYRKERDGDGPDCDVIIDTTENATIAAAANNVALQNRVAQILKDKKDVDALMQILACKVTFWQTNHHTGGGKLAHYAKKVFDLKWKGDVGGEQQTSDRCTGDVHTISHWGSTCFLLKKLGFKKVRTPDSYGEGARFTITDDVKLRTSVFPAGTAKYGACKEALKRLCRMALFAAFPNPQDVVAFLDACDEIKNNEAEYHVGGEYLSETGAKKTMPNPTLCWRMSAFVRAFYPKTKLAEAAAFGTENLATYEDVFISWENLCRQMAAMAIETEIDVSVFSGSATMKSSGETIETVMGRLNLTIPDEVKLASNAIAESQGQRPFFNMNLN
ncbi:Ribosome-binding factor A [Frankliniella fusca]|uniref:Ribosome-binding factor A n=1 Tax=Frankliniella fusca TaxID=407009 RepID=A0AAE1L7V7_9NEOP|nr:Ribosome-binding factor A [Frankliniella fusca]